MAESESRYRMLRLLARAAKKYADYKAPGVADKVIDAVEDSELADKLKARVKKERASGKAV